MTNEEAKTVLINCTTFIKDSFRYMKEEHQEQFKEAYRMAIQALEKQIPKKVIRNHTKYKPRQTDTFNCPACNSENVIIEDNASYTQINYCNDCGQRLDWRMENDE